MSNGLSPKDVKKQGLLPVSGIVSAQQITEEVGLTAGGSLNLRVDILTSAVTQVGTITLQLQHRTDGHDSWANVAGANATTTITAAGTASLTQCVNRAADQANMPLKKMVRVVLTTTNAGDAVTVSYIMITQEL